MKKVNKMSKYASNIYKRKDGRWEGIYKVHSASNIKQIHNHTKKLQYTYKKFCNFFQSICVLFIGGDELYVHN